MARHMHIRSHIQPHPAVLHKQGQAAASGPLAHYTPQGPLPASSHTAAANCAGRNNLRPDCTSHWCTTPMLQTHALKIHTPPTSPTG